MNKDKRDNGCRRTTCIHYNTQYPECSKFICSKEKEDRVLCAESGFDLCYVKRERGNNE